MTPQAKCGSLEKTMAGRNLAGSPWIPTIFRGLSDCTSPLTWNFLSLWGKLNKAGKYSPRLSPLVPLGGYPLVSQRGGSKILRSMGAGWGHYVWQIYPTGNFILFFSDLVSVLGNIPIDRWRYHPMSFFFNKLKLLLRPLKSLTTFESLCLYTPNARHLLSQMYKCKK